MYPSPSHHVTGPAVSTAPSAQAEAVVLGVAGAERVRQVSKWSCLAAAGGGCPTDGATRLGVWIRPPALYSPWRELDMEGAFVLWCFCAAERRCSDRCEIIDYTEFCLQVLIDHSLVAVAL